MSLLRRACVEFACFSLLLGGLGPAACQQRVTGPTEVAEAYARAVQRRDAKAVLELIDTTAAQRLAFAAERASDQVGGRRSIEPWEMLQIVQTDPLRQLASSEVLERSDTRARVRLTDNQARTYDLDLVFESDTWHVRVPAPPRAAEPDSP
jgi:hypothetical protein